MATIQVYHQEENRFYQITVSLATAVLPTDNLGRTTNYLTISTNMKYPDGTAFPVFRVVDLTDVPPSYTPPDADWTELVNHYIAYFIDQAGLGYSSSSSSLSSSSSSSISSNSSSSHSLSSSSSSSP